MADITSTAAQVRRIFPDRDTVFTGTAGVALTAGQAVYWHATTGKLTLADASAAGTAQARGIALNTVSAGQNVECIKEGFLGGFAVSGLSYDDVVQLSDTAGALDSGGAPTKANTVGRVAPLPDGDITKVLYVDFNWQAEIS